MEKNNVGLSAYSLSEIVNLGVHGQIPNMSYLDWETVESKMFEWENLIAQDYDESELQSQLADVEYELECTQDKVTDLEEEIERLQKLLEENEIEY